MKPKFFLQISKEEQARRLAEINSNPLRHWQLTPVDSKAQKLWDEYSKYESLMFEKTNSPKAPWIIINAEKRSGAILEPLEHILKTIPYKIE